MEWRRSILVPEAAGYLEVSLRAELRTHWGFYLASSLLTALACSVFVRFVLG